MRAAPDFKLVVRKLREMAAQFGPYAQRRVPQVGRLDRGRRLDARTPRPPRRQRRRRRTRRRPRRRRRRRRRSMVARRWATAPTASTTRCGLCTSSMSATPSSLRRSTAAAPAAAVRAVLPVRARLPDDDALPADEALGVGAGGGGDLLFGRRISPARPPTCCPSSCAVRLCRGRRRADASRAHVARRLLAAPLPAGWSVEGVLAAVATHAAPPLHALIDTGARSRATRTSRWRRGCSSSGCRTAEAACTSTRRGAR